MADSIKDFLDNKNTLYTPVSDLVLFSNLNTKTVIFQDVKIEKELDNVFEFGKEGEKGYTAKLYRVYNETGEFFSYWPNKNSKLNHALSCDRFEEIKNFRSNLIKSAMILHSIREDFNIVYLARFYNPKSKKKVWLEQLTPAFPNPLFVHP